MSASERHDRQGGDRGAEIGADGDVTDDPPTGGAGDLEGGLERGGGAGAATGATSASGGTAIAAAEAGLGPGAVGEHGTSEAGLGGGTGDLGGGGDLAGDVGPLDPEGGGPG